MMGFGFFAILFYLVAPKGGAAGILASGGVAVVAALACLNKVSLSRSAFRVLIGLVFFIIYIVVNFFYSSVFGSGEQSVNNLIDPLRYIFSLCFLVIGYSVVDDRSKGLAKFVILLVGVNFCVVLMQKLAGEMFYAPFTTRGVEEIRSGYLSRAIGTIGNPNALAAFFSVFLVFSFVRLKRDLNIYDALVVVLSLAIVVLSQSRSTMVYMLVALVVYVAIYFEYKLSIWFAILVLPMLLVLGFFIYSKLDLGYLVGGFESVAAGGLENQSSFAARLDFWSHAYNVLIADLNILIMGLGVSSFNERIGVVDNAYIYGLLKYGLPYLFFIGIFVYFGCLARARLVRDSSEARYLFLCILILCMCSMTGDMLENFSFLAIVFFLGGRVLRIKSDLEVEKV